MFSSSHRLDSEWLRHEIPECKEFFTAGYNFLNPAVFKRQNMKSTEKIEPVLLGGEMHRPRPAKGPSEYPLRV